MKDGITFLFSGKLLTHFQARNLPYFSNEHLFFIFVVYGTYKLYRHIIIYVMRNQNK